MRIILIRSSAMKTKINVVMLLSMVVYQAFTSTSGRNKALRAEAVQLGEAEKEQSLPAKGRSIGVPGGWIRPGGRNGLGRS